MRHFVKASTCENHSLRRLPAQRTSFRRHPMADFALILAFSTRSMPRNAGTAVLGLDVWSCVDVDWYARHRGGTRAPGSTAKVVWHNRPALSREGGFSSADMVRYLAWPAWPPNRAASLTSIPQSCPESIMPSPRSASWVSHAPRFAPIGLGAGNAMLRLSTISNPTIINNLLFVTDLQSRFAFLTIIAARGMPGTGRAVSLLPIRMYGLRSGVCLGVPYWGTHEQRAGP